MSSAVHVVPTNDLIRHDSSGGQTCVCGPTEQPVEGDNGTVRWLVVHHSLDGRERSEPRG